MIEENRGIDFEWDGTACEDGKYCEIVISNDLGYVLEVRKAFEGRYAYFVDKLTLDPNNDEEDVCVGQWHAATEAQAQRAAEDAFLRHLEGGPTLVQ